MTDHEHVYQIIRNTVRESVWRHSGNTDLAATVADDVLITCRAGLGPTLDTDGVNVAAHYLRSRHPELQSNREGESQEDVIEQAKHVVTVALIDKIGHGHEQMGSDYWGLEAEAIVEGLASAGLLAVTPASKHTQSQEATDA